MTLADRFNNVAIIPARGGSKGIPKKNIIDVAGKPLIQWSIEQALASDFIQDVYVSSDCEEILAVAEKCGAIGIKRPDELSGDTASSESAWIHAVQTVCERREKAPDYYLGMQATSPIRESEDVDKAFEVFFEEKLDSLFASCIVHDFFYWERDEQGKLYSSNYDYKNRRRRQKIKPRYLENGSFYIFSKEILEKEDNRLGGNIGTYIMEDYKKFQIDEPMDLKICEAIIKQFILKGTN